MKCPVCGGNSERRNGTFEFLGMKFQDSEWEVCIDGCKETIIPPQLIKRIEQHKRH